MADHRTRRLTLWLGLGLLLLGGTILRLSDPHVAIANMDLPGAGRARLYRPVHATAKMPAVVLIRGVLATKETMDAYGVQMASAGIEGISPEFPADTTEAQLPVVRLALQWLSQQADLDPERLGVIGHSLGAFTAAEATWREKSVIASATFGLYVDGDLAVDYKNFMVGTGAYDRYHPPAEMLASLRTLTQRQDATAGTLYGSFQDRNARRLVISPYPDHGGEIVDPALLHEVCVWMLQSFGQDPAKARSFITWGWPALLPGLFLLLPRIFCWTIPQFRQVALGTGLACLAAAVFAESGFAVAMSAVTGVSLVVAGHLTRPGRPPGDPIKYFAPGLLRVGAPAACALAGYVLVQAAYDTPVVAQQHLSPVTMPMHLMITYGATPAHAVLSSIRNLFDGPWRWLATACCGMVPLLEAIRPGMLGGTAVRNWQRVPSVLRWRPIRPTFRQLVALGLASAGAVIAWQQALPLLDAAQLGIFLGAFTTGVIRYALLPAAAGWGLYRILFKSRLYNSWH